MIKTFPAPLEDPIVEVVTIGPDEAEELLTFNTNNRRMRPRNIDGWVKDMQAGEWSLNGETLKVAYDGWFMDGQNRMTAIIQSGTKQRFLIVWGLPREAQDTVDVGVKRIFADMLKMHGYANVTVLAGITRHTLLWEAGERRSIGHGKIVPTNIELSRHLYEHPELVGIARRAMWQYSHFRALSPTTMGLGIYLFDKINTDECEDFFIRLIEGANMDRNHPIMALRRQLLQRHTHMTTRLLPEQKIAIMIKAWNYYRDGRSIEALRWVGGGKSPEPFPEPR